jgi:hypothetical protein
MLPDSMCRKGFKYRGHSQLLLICNQTISQIHLLSRPHVPNIDSMARAVKVKYVCMTNHPLMASLMYRSLSIHSQMMELFGDNFQRGMGAIFVHKHLLSERPTYSKDLIDKKETEDYNKVPNEDDQLDDDGYDNRHLVVELVDTSQRACIKLVRWVYGQPMLDPDKPHKWDLSDLAEIYHISCIEDEESSTWDTECMEACFDAYSPRPKESWRIR